MPALASKPKSAAAAGTAYLRERRGVTREEVAGAMREHGHDWDYTTVSNIENDRRRLRPRELRDLARLLGVDQDFLIDGAELAEAGGGVLGSPTAWFDYIAVMPTDAHDHSLALAA